MPDHHYTSCYCEENIWHLCSDSAVLGSDKKVIWIGGAHGICPLWHQRAAEQPDAPVWWDYHVILLARSDSWRVWDLDTTLGLSVPADEYFKSTFKQIEIGTPVFRLMDADYYHQLFSSNRSHMRTSDVGWHAPPPLWPAILQGRQTFSEMIDFNSTEHGELLDLDDVRRCYCAAT